MQERKTPLSSGAPAWCRPKTLGRENKYPHFERKKAKGILVCAVLFDNQKQSPLSMEVYTYLPGLLVRMKITKILVTA